MRLSRAKFCRLQCPARLLCVIIVYSMSAMRFFPFGTLSTFCTVTVEFGRAENCTPLTTFLTLRNNWPSCRQGSANPAILQNPCVCHCPHRRPTAPQGTWRGQVVKVLKQTSLRVIAESCFCGSVHRLHGFGHIGDLSNEFTLPEFFVLRPTGGQVVAAVFPG